MNEHEIYQEAIRKWGIEAQVIMAVEEMSELTKALCKWRRTGSLTKALKEQVADEIADVHIMLEQLKILFSIDAEVGVARMAKLKRLQEKLEHG
jgi:NTP pyrophosphatase (non-canonical NTP hydrolase)